MDGNTLAATGIDNCCEKPVGCQLKHVSEDVHVAFYFYLKKKCNHKQIVTSEVATLPCNSCSSMLESVNMLATCNTCNRATTSCLCNVSLFWPHRCFGVVLGDSFMLLITYHTCNRGYTYLHIYIYTYICMCLNI